MPITGGKKHNHPRAADHNPSSGTPMSSPLQKMLKLKSLVSQPPKVRQPAPIWDNRTPPYHWMMDEPEKFIKWLVTDLPPGHYDAEIHSLRYFNDHAEPLV